MKINFDDTTPTLGLKFSDADEDVDFNVNPETDESFSPGFSEVTEVTTDDHRKLINRDAENQHPISSITGLSEELESKPGEALTNLEIESLLK